MSLEVITKIKEAEDAAKLIVQQAQDKANEIIAKTKSDAESNMNEAMSTFEMEKKKMLDESFQRAQDKATHIKQDVTNQCLQLKEQANKNKQRAIEFVVNEIKRK